MVYKRTSERKEDDLGLPPWLRKHPLLTFKGNGETWWFIHQRHGDERASNMLFCVMGKKRASWIWVFWGSSILTIIHLWWSRPGRFTWWFQILQKSLGTSLSGQGKGLKQIWSILTKINVPPIMAVSEHLVTVYYENLQFNAEHYDQTSNLGHPSFRQTNSCNVVIQSMKLPYVKYCQHVFGHFLPNTSECSGQNALMDFGAQTLEPRKGWLEQRVKWFIDSIFYTLW